MNQLSPIVASAAVSATVAALLSIWMRPAVAPAATAEAPRTLEARPLPGQLERIDRALGELDVSLASLGQRLRALEQTSGARAREPVAALEAPALPDDAMDLLSALAGGESPPPSFDLWVDEAIENRRTAEREERRLALEQTLGDLISERMVDLDELLDLDPYQSDEVETVLTDQMSAVSRALSEAESPLDMMMAVGPIREARDAQLEQILSPSQLTTFKEQEPAMGGPRMLFGGRPR